MATATKRRGGAPRGNQNAVGNKGGPGAPSKFDPTIPERAYKLALLGLTDAEMATAFGISETTVNAWKREHVEFAASLTRGKAEADAEVAHGLYERAKTGDAHAARYWLNNRQPVHWRDRIEHTGSDGAPIRFVVEDSPRRGGQAQ